MVAIFSQAIDVTSAATMQRDSDALSRISNEFIKTPNVKIVDIELQTVYNGADLFFVLLINYESSPR